MKFKLYFFSLVLLTWQSIYAQQHFVDPEAVNATTGYSGTGSNIDVVYHRCNWTVQNPNVGKNLSGVVTTYFKTTAANVSSISFDLNSTSFTNNSFASFSTSPRFSIKRFFVLT